MTTKFKPMLACSKIPAAGDITYPVIGLPKLDGIRCLIRDGKAYSRTLKLIPNKHVQNTLQAMNLPDLDGELMVKGDFNNVQSAIMSHTGEPDFVYHVFDIVTSEPYHVRQRSLDELISNRKQTKLDITKVILVPRTILSDEAQLLEYWVKCEKLGYEGAIVRKPDGKYKYGRSTLKEGLMLKLKSFADDEATVVGYEELMRNTDTSTRHQDNLVAGGMLGALLVEWQTRVFKVGSGFDEATRIALWNNPQNLLGKKITFKYQGTSAYGVPRFPTFKAFRDGY